MSNAAQFTADPLDGTTDINDLSRPYYGISFGDAVKRFFKNYANFTGRASRGEYWWVVLFTFIVGVIFGLIGSIGGEGSALNAICSAVLGIFGLAVIIPSLALHWRRLHDANLAGPFWFLTFIPVVGSIIVFILTLLPPKPEGRRFVSKY